MKTCGQCKYFDVDRGPGGGKLRHSNAPGSCTYEVTWPVLPLSFAEYSYANGWQRPVFKLPRVAKMNASINTDRCATFEAKDVKVEKQMGIE